MEFGSGAVNGSQVRRCLGISVRPVSRRIQPESIVLNRSSLLLYPGMSEQLTATISPANAADKMVSWTSDNTSAVTVDGNGIVYAVAIGSATITATTHDGNLTATCTVTVRQPVTGAVDLGLSVKWASFNVGATAPEEYGDYFAWGETESKTDYSWSSYKWCNGDYNKLTKYCLGDQSYYWNGEGTPDGKTVLDPEDDPAITNWGGTWRTPTDAECLDFPERSKRIFDHRHQRQQHFPSRRRLPGWFCVKRYGGPRSLLVFVLTSKGLEPSMGRTLKFLLCLQGTKRPTPRSLRTSRRMQSLELLNITLFDRSDFGGVDYRNLP